MNTIDKTLTLTTQEVDMLLNLLDKRGNTLMRQTSSKSEWELQKIENLVDKIWQQTQGLPLCS